MPGLLATCAFVLAGAAHTATTSVTDIEAAAHRAVVQALTPSLAPSARLLVETGHVDERLRLPQCAAPLQAALLEGPAAQSRQIVEVRCPGVGGWRTRIAATVMVEQDVSIALRLLPRGTPLDRADFATTRRRIPGTASDLVAPADMPEKRRLARPVTAGTVLSYAMLDHELAVRRGQQVTLLARSAIAEIRASGQALADARPGERVRARNLSSQRIVEGVAGQDSTILVQP